MRARLRRLAGVFVAGLLAALPLAATVFIFAWGSRLVFSWLGPGSALGRGGIPVPGWAAVVMGVLLAATATARFRDRDPTGRPRD